MLNVGSILGILKQQPDKWFEKGKNYSDKEIQVIKDLIKKRNLARVQKKFNLADEIRKELLTLGVEIKDSHDGVKWNWIK